VRGGLHRTAGRALACGSHQPAISKKAEMLTG
jgi:hypothetical protein